MAWRGKRKRQNGQVNSLQGAGGIGGLLALEDFDAGTSQTGGFLYFYDAGGNVGQLVDTDTGYIEVKYEYDPYGRRTNTPVSGELEQPFRFSTKFCDTESGLYYFGYRYYQPTWGRWMNRDPLEENGGYALYSFALNDPIGLIDLVGTHVLGCPLTLKQSTQPTTIPSDNCIVDNPSPRPTAEQCCDAIRKAPCFDDDAGGGVVCCRGKITSCVWFTDPPPGPGAGNILRGCMIRHEGTHHDDISCKDCPSGKVCRPYWKNPDQASAEECKGYTAEIICLKRRKSQCIDSKLTKEEREQCRETVQARIMQLCDLAEEQTVCGARPKECPPTKASPKPSGNAG